MSLFKKVLANLKAKTTPDTPSPYKLADDQDELGWERRTDGLMADAGTSDDAVETHPFKADA